MTDSSHPNRQQVNTAEPDNDSPSLLAHRRGVNPLTVTVDVRAGVTDFFKIVADPIEGKIEVCQAQLEI